MILVCCWYSGLYFDLIFIAVIKLFSHRDRPLKTYSKYMEYTVDIYLVEKTAANKYGKNGFETRAKKIHFLKPDRALTTKMFLWMRKLNPTVIVCHQTLGKVRRSSKKERFLNVNVSRMEPRDDEFCTRNRLLCLMEDGTRIGERAKTINTNISKNAPRRPYAIPVSRTGNRKLPPIKNPPGYALHIRNAASERPGTLLLLLKTQRTPPPSTGRNGNQISPKYIRLDSDRDEDEPVIKKPRKVLKIDLTKQNKQTQEPLESEFHKNAESKKEGIQNGVLIAPTLRVPHSSEYGFESQPKPSEGQEPANDLSLEKLMHRITTRLSIHQHQLKVSWRKKPQQPGSNIADVVDEHRFEEK
ncbi:hypothetical protein GCK72_022807 [Caenorhabditis remanei]|uniref:Uncharacterized protein n=1 Tax=Caenorhabditis remanei TaxID=31234 RepID=A0A6A5FUY5_CAERE|nr:hypothetical protein GCK72_022807 [Caenorhabditis remanei]KAF1746354.1 hypothetical protein GCK72_022807 [Caenorhabditis remanei]